MIVLGIESSCDETAVSICKDGKILSNIVSSQQVHSNYGGVVPEVASREHDRLLNQLVIKSIKEANISLNDIQGIGVTKGPGLAGTLLTGVSFAKGFSQSLNIPIIGINHLEAHIYANFLAYPKLEYPLVCLLVSGGHTQIWYIKNIFDYELLGDTRDDAAGEAFDKGARILGLGYPGGPIIEKIAKKGNSDLISFPKAFMEKDNLEFSFSGLKTSLLYLVKKNQLFEMEDIVASYQKAILDVLVTKLARSVIIKKVNTCIIAGGVAANKSLRRLVEDKLNATINVYYPDINLCTDNAAMIAFLAEIYFKKGIRSNLDFEVIPNLKLK
ncbi:MAG: tRNA (adenosine(37)-N6)-threonylcarbamoyltransferase complex transferase subunit TsaD [Candidatus Neomarinimicrobiota bacterium]|nr:tRNA (adenosine(37)-N6)-threonylcarbamoyltransferase complex transferase subunit TsaD [Candidatus Neomarinimicrobiota bacterium]MEC9105943.1 tRNA (adenosine(37)-N6)-threonylcarbamoyltransferase complex transferase subunit TsaD [Candidatus Neomarinimicrobiota bacterium]MED5256444.1 tRNA (adenosine(37)-N6)-threonylcarbamoyltransferase complex transferase subunit TsaD [Candidatus Neomarinimicrobiota bacterium]